MIWGLLGGVLTDVVSDWREGRKNKREIKKAAAEFRQEQARSEGVYKQEWELRALEGADIWPRRLVLFLFSFPLIWAYFDPQAVEVYFKVSLAAIPEWYKQAYMLMLASVWGLSEFRNIRAGKA